MSFLKFNGLQSSFFFFPGVHDDEDVKQMLQGSSMVKVIAETLKDDITLLEAIE